MRPKSRHEDARLAATRRYSLPRSDRLPGGLPFPKRYAIAIGCDSHDRRRSLPQRWHVDLLSCGTSGSERKPPRSLVEVSLCGGSHVVPPIQLVLTIIGLRDDRDRCLHRTPASEDLPRISRSTCPSARRIVRRRRGGKPKVEKASQQISPVAQCPCTINVALCLCLQRCSHDSRTLGFRVEDEASSTSVCDKIDGGSRPVSPVVLGSVASQTQLPSRRDT